MSKRYRGRVPGFECFNYGEAMGSSNRSTFFPERALRRQEPKSVREGDYLARKHRFACGTARRIGWALAIWQNPYARALHRARIAEALALREVAPLPG